MATEIPVGLVVFDVFLGGPDGTTGFFVSNLTGDPATGGFALPPDFPVATSIVFDAPSLDWIGPAGSPFDFAGAGIGPGNLDPAPAIQFPDTTMISSATFTALLSAPLFQLTDGRVFQAASASISAILSNAGGALVPGDFAVLSVEADEVTAVDAPEPAALTLLGAGLIAAACRRRLRRSDFRVIDRASDR
jgi:hypothetical protein